MTSAVVNRKPIRKAIAAALAAAIIGTGKSTKAVYAYKPKKFTAGTPAVCVASSSSERKKISSPSVSSGLLRFDIHIFVRYTADGWTEENSEDAVDDIEANVSDFVVDASEGAGYNNLRFDGETLPDPILIDGVAYQHEIIPIIVSVSGGELP